jgi:hypothetical protein
MNNFCLTNERGLVNGKWTYKKYLRHGIWLYYDSGVEVIDLPQHVIVFCGILWQGKVTNFANNIKQNGIFYAVVFNKVTGKVQVINDVLDSFFLNYYVSGKHFVVTNEIKVYGPSFKINQAWVNWSKLGVKLMDAPTKPHPDLTPPTKFRDVTLQNITPINGVKYLGAGQVLTLQTVDEQLTSSCHTYFSYNDDICKVFDEKPQHDYKSALDTAKWIIRENCKRIKEKYGDKLIHFCSTGIDSLTLRTYLDDVPMCAYYSEEFDTYHESPELFKRMYNDHGGILHCFDTRESIQNAIDVQLLKIEKTHSYNPHQMMFLYMRDRYKLNDRVMITGSFGDHVFWHWHPYPTRHAIHRWGMTNAEQIWDRLLPHYGFGGPAVPAGTYSQKDRTNQIQEVLSAAHPDFKTACMSLRYFNGKMSAIVSQFWPNQLNLDPYADLRLWKLLPSCDIQTQEASILDAQIQKDMISDKWLPYLTPHKCGNNLYYEQDLNNKHFRKKMIANLIKNIHD